MAAHLRRAAEGEPIVNEGKELNVAIWCLTAFSWLFLALRIYCKVWRRRSLWWDDYILILAWTSILSSTVMLSVGVNYGIGLHYDDMRPDYIPVTAQLSYAAGFCAIMGTAWSKTSFALTMLRITTGPMKWFLIFIIVTVNVVLGVSGTMMWISCWPTQKLWYPETPGTCWDRTVGEKYQTFASTYSATMDIILALLPWRIVWNAKLNKREMVGALVAMSAGVISGIITYLKILVLPEISDDDSTTVNLKIYGTAEPAVAIIAASIPVLRAFLQKRSKSQQTGPEGSELSNITSLSSPTATKSPGRPSWQQSWQQDRPSWQQQSWQTGKSQWQHHEIRNSVKN